MNYLCLATLKDVTLEDLVTKAVEIKKGKTVETDGCLEEIVERAYNTIKEMDEEELELAMSYYNVGSHITSQAIERIDSKTGGAATAAAEEVGEHIQDAILEVLSERTGIPEAVVGKIITSNMGNPKVII